MPKQVYLFGGGAPAPKSWAAEHQAQCGLCPLDRQRDLTHPKMGADGPAEQGEAYVYVIGEAPGKQEDAKGVPFIGPSGKYLRAALAPHFEKNEVIFWNTVRCRPPENRTPTEAEVECCRPFIEGGIARAQPRRILLVGGTALR